MDWAIDLTIFNLIQFDLVFNVIAAILILDFLTFGYWTVMLRLSNKILYHLDILFLSRIAYYSLFTWNDSD